MGEAKHFNISFLFGFRYNFKVGGNDKYLLEPKVRLSVPRVRVELKLNISDLKVCGNIQMLIKENNIFPSNSTKLYFPFRDRTIEHKLPTDIILYFLS